MSIPRARSAKPASSPRRILEEQNLAPLKKYGQNFLVDGNMREFLLRSADLTPDTLVLEIGAGLGIFTAEIARLVGFVVAVEIDPRLASLAREELSIHSNATLVEGDALGPDHETLAPAVRSVLEEKLAAGYRPIRVLSNLPYNGAATMIVALLESGLSIDRMVVTIQKEVAERIAAKPGDRENSALTLLVQSLADVRILRRVPPAVFWPRPKVESSILEIVTRQPPLVDMAHQQTFKELLRILFRHPRKTLLGSSGGAPGLAKDEAREVFRASGVSPLRRPHTLTAREATSILMAKRRLGDLS